MQPSYLRETGWRIVASRRTETPRYGMAADGYTRPSGAPTSLVVRIAGDGLSAGDAARWRRVMVWQFANAGTAFVRVRGTDYIVIDADIPAED